MKPSSLPTYARVLVALLALLLIPCPGVAADEETALGERAWISRLSPHTWLVISEFDFPSFGTVPSNALVVEGEQGSILIDTPVTDPQTERVLNWAETVLKKPVLRVIVTHAHEDRLGGLGATHRRGIPSYALARTTALATERKFPVPRRRLGTEDSLRIPGIEVFTHFPGHGHTEDNIVVWIPVDGVLHGGCFVKGSDANNLGNLEEINPSTWKMAVADVTGRYEKARIVVPGHGAAGDLGLLRHTGNLIDAHIRAIADGTHKE